MLPKINSRFRLFRGLTSPISVMALVWSLSLIVYYIASSLGDDYTYFHLLVRQENLADTSTYITFFLLFGVFLVFVMGAMFQSMIFRNQNLRMETDFDENRAFLMLFNVFLFSILIAFLWVGIAIIQFGGLGRLAALAASDNVMAREVIRSASFPGGRLISSGFIGTTLFSIVLLAKNKNLSIRQKNITVLICFLSLLYLALIPILLSGRINFFVAVLSSFVALIYIRQRLIDFKYIFMGILSLMIVWTAKEYFVLGHIAEDTSASDQGLQGLIFYFYNDLLNVLNTIDKFEGIYTYGWYSIRFIFYFTFTDRAFLDFIFYEKQTIGEYVSAGEVPLLGGPIVDFGFFGVFYLFFLGMICQYIYLGSRFSTGHVLRYALIFAGLLMSVHGSYLTNQEVAYNMILVSLLARWSKPAPSKVAKQSYILENHRRVRFNK